MALATAAGPVWRKRMQDLSRQAGLAHPPLFAPLLFAVAAQIEAITPREFANDGTRIRKNVGELRRALGTDSVVCCVPSGIEAEALGVPHEASGWPPRASGSLRAPLPAEPDAAAIAASPRVAATREAVRQWQADTSQPVIVAALTGPATLLGELRAAGAVVDDALGYQIVGGSLAVLARLYAEAGVQVVQLCEVAPPPAADTELWKGALATVGNVARFHRVAPLLTVAESSPSAWPAQLVACAGDGQSAPPAARPHGRAWPADPATWATCALELGAARIIATPREVAPDHDVATLRSIVRSLLGG